MNLVHFEVAYHLNTNPDRTRVIRLLTSPQPSAVDEYLIRKYGPGNVVLHYAMLAPVHPWPPASAFDKALWRLL